MSTILWNLLFFLIALSILIAVHEFGHFWVARKCGVKVHRFSIGFGKALWQRTGKDGTEYTLAMIPLGGYVKMLDGRVDDVPPELEHQAFDKQSVSRRTAIVAAGPLFNFIFAIFAYWVVMMMGIPALKPVIGEVTPNSIAAKAGLESGMELVDISGIKTPDWQSVNLQMIGHIGDDKMWVGVKPEVGVNYSLTKELDLSNWSFEPDTDSALETIGMIPYSPAIKTVVAQVMDESAAQKAGIEVGDKILSLNSKKIDTWKQIVEVIRSHPESKIEVGLLRQGKNITLGLTPHAREQDGKSIGYAGFAPEVEPWPESYRFTLQYNPLDAIPAALDKTWQVVTLTVSMVKKLFTGDVAIKNLSGPISIAKGAGMTADFGFVYFLSFLALISVNLGIMNLLPLPVLDGGHLLFFGIEAIMRRPVSERTQEIGYKIGSFLIMLMMVVAIFNDFNRL